MIALSHVSVRFGNKIVFSDFTHTFPTQKTTAIMGASGCGKTTLLRLFAGLIRPTEGTVYSNKNVSILFQEPRLLPWLTAAENVNLVLDDTKQTITQANALLASVGLDTDKDKYPAELSGGMQQRVALARTLARPTKLILLDEPFKGLDPKTKGEMMILIQKHTQGKTVLLVTHDKEEAEQMSDTILTL